MAKEHEQTGPTVSLPLDEFVRSVAGLAGRAGRAGAREVIGEMNILPRLEAVEHGLTSQRVFRGKLVGIAAGVAAVAGIIAIILKLFSP